MLHGADIPQFHFCQTRTYLATVGLALRHSSVMLFHRSAVVGEFISYWN